MPCDRALDRSRNIGGAAVEMASILLWQACPVGCQQAPEKRPMDTAPYTQRRPVRSMFQPRLQHNILFLFYAASLFALFAALFAFVQFGTPHLADNDGYYHIRMGQIIRSQGLRINFSWLPLTILRPDAFYDHHLLYHVYLALFVGDGQPERMVLGAKLASVLMPAFACLAIWWLLRAQRVPWAALWSLGLFAVSEAFLYRMSMPRAQSASLAVLALGLHWLLQRRYLPLMPLGFFYVWLYNAFPLVLLLASIYIVATLLTERQFAWRALAYPLVGVILGLAINPYFPANIAFIIQHLVPKVGQPATSVGSEWYPYSTWALVQNTGVALALWLLGILALGWREQHIDRPTLTALLLSIVFGLLLFKARRFVEYFPPFALIFTALSSAPLLRTWSTSRLYRRWATLLLIGALAAPLGGALGAARLTMAESRPAATYKAAAEWLGTHTPPGSLIFQTDWDDFPRLFFYNQTSRYTIGLDPTFMQRYDPALYQEWVAMTQGKVESLGEKIRTRFGAAYVLSDHQHIGFLREAARDPQMKEIYRDHDAVIFAIVDDSSKRGDEQWMSTED
jgi:hypothetical protein